MTRSTQCVFNIRLDEHNVKEYYYNNYYPFDCSRLTTYTYIPGTPKTIQSKCHIICYMCLSNPVYLLFIDISY